jgi:IS30 family transposase
VIYLKKFKHLTLKERELLFVWYEQKISLREIGRRLGRDHTSLADELRINRKGKGNRSHEYFSSKYMPCIAHEKALKRAVKQRTKAPLKNPKVFLYVRGNLRQGLSPECIAGRLRLDLKGEIICKETIYSYIYSVKGKRYKLWKYLTQSRKKRQNKQGRKVQRSRISGSVSIDLRPMIAHLRQRFGDWESDFMIGKQVDKTALSVTVERLTRYTLLTKQTDRSAQTKTDELIQRLSIFPQSLRQTLTLDNGAENTHHQQISQQLNLDVFFCHSYHSWERGTNENTIGRIRRFIPKGVSIDTIPKKYIEKLEKRLNNTPRKCLGYLTPKEKMLEYQQSNT